MVTIEGTPILYTEQTPPYITLEICQNVACFRQSGVVLTVNYIG
jgi:hypothetical protein